MTKDKFIHKKCGGEIAVTYWGGMVFSTPVVHVKMQCGCGAIDVCPVDSKQFRFLHDTIAYAVERFNEPFDLATSLDRVRQCVESAGIPPANPRAGA